MEIILCLLSLHHYITTSLHQHTQVTTTQHCNTTNIIALLDVITTMPSTRAQGKRKADAADLSGSLNNRSSAKEPRRTVEPAVSVEDLDRTDLWHLIEEAATIHKGAREVIEGHREHLCDGLSESKCRAIVIELAGAYESMRDSIEHVRTARDLKPGSTFARVVAVVATPTVFTELRDRVDTAIHCLDDVDCTRVTNFSCKVRHFPSVPPPQVTRASGPSSIVFCPRRHARRGCAIPFACRKRQCRSHPVN